MVDKNPEISIIIPAYNEEDYIRETLHSIKNQTFQGYEVIVVTNGCTDKTEEVVKKRASEKVKPYNISKPNVSRARNYGAGKSTGKILLFLDADTTLEKDALQEIRQQFSSSHSVATFKVKPDQNKFKYNLLRSLQNFHNLTGLYKGCSGSLVCRRDDFEVANGYNPDIIVKEHRKLILKLLEKGKYKCLDAYVTTSMRRFQNWGIGKATSFWVKQWFKSRFGDLKTSDYEKVR